MSGWEILVGIATLVAVTAFLSARPARGTGSIAESPLLQAIVFACSLAWGAVVGISSLLAVILATWGREPPLWPFVLLGIAASAACLAWLGRPWGNAGSVSEGRRMDAAEGDGS